MTYLSSDQAIGVERSWVGWDAGYDPRAKLTPRQAAYARRAFGAGYIGGITDFERAMVTIARAYGLGSVGSRAILTAVEHARTQVPASTARMSSDTTQRRTVR